MTSCSPLSRSNSAMPSLSTPTRAFAAVGFDQTSTPRIVRRPASGRSSPVAIDRVVVLPAPFGPTRPKNEPAGTSRSMPSTAIFSPKRL